jgi:hypothetical protein
MENKLAVEWFASRISHGGLVSKKQFNELLEKAKVMEEDAKHKSYLYGHRVGYKKAEENHLEQSGYSEEDVRLAYFQGEKDSYIKGGQTKEMENEFIQSLKQKKQQEQ